jgi:hypothetical protein
VLVVWAALTIIYWSNIFRFHPEWIDLAYDSTSEELVPDRMAKRCVGVIAARASQMAAENIDPP